MINNTKSQISWKYYFIVFENFRGIVFANNEKNFTTIFSVNYLKNRIKLLFRM